MAWNIDTTHSAVSFTVRHLVFAKVRGRFTKFSGVVNLDEQELGRSSVEVSIETASVDTGTPDRDNHLRSPDFFDAAKYPALTFKSAKVEKGGKGFKVTGALSLHGVTKDVTLDVEDVGRAKDPWGNQRAIFSASASLDRRDFGLTWNQALETGGVLVGEKVEIELEVQAVAAQAGTKAA